MIDNNTTFVSASTIKNTSVSTNYEKYEGLYRLDKTLNTTYSFFMYSENKISENEINNDIYTDEILMSDKYKILWGPNIGLYNLYYTTFSQLLEIVKDNKDVIILINKTSMCQEENMPHFTFILDWLTSLGIEWKFFEPIKPIYIKNFYKIKHEVITKQMIDDVYNFSQSFVKNKNIKPFRKVYVSRRHIPTRNYHWIKPGLSTNKDDRLNDHEVLESFLEQNGFEIIIPEQNFKSFDEQINYFNEVNVLASLSSSGISNSLFMQPKTTIIEFMTTYPTPWESDPEVPSDGIEGIHHLYHAQAYLKNHNYIAIPNHTRMSIDIINKIKETDFLSSIFLKDKYV